MEYTDEKRGMGPIPVQYRAVGGNHSMKLLLAIATLVVCLTVSTIPY